MKIMIFAATLAIAMPAFAQETTPAPDMGLPPSVAPLEDSIPPLDAKPPASQTPTDTLTDARLLPRLPGADRRGFAADLLQDHNRPLHPAWRCAPQAREE